VRAGRKGSRGVISGEALNWEKTLTDGLCGGFKPGSEQDRLTTGGAESADEKEAARKGEG